MTKINLVDMANDGAPELGHPPYTEFRPLYREKDIGVFDVEVFDLNEGTARKIRACIDDVFVYGLSDMDAYELDEDKDDSDEDDSDEDGLGHDVTWSFDDKVLSAKADRQLRRASRGPKRVK